jgi:hypothetical protein
MELISKPYVQYFSNVYMLKNVIMHEHVRYEPWMGFQLIIVL